MLPKILRTRNQSSRSFHVSSRSMSPKYSFKELDYMIDANELEYTPLEDKYKIAYLRYEEMKQKGIKPLRAAEYNIVLTLYSKLNKRDEATKLFDELKNHKTLQPDQFTYTIMMNMNVKLRDPAAALSYFQEMKAKGIKPNEITYSILIDMYSKHNQPNEALSMYQVMKKENVEPNIFTYNTLIIMYTRLDQFQEAFNLFNHMKETNVQINIHTYNAMIELLCKFNKHQDVISMFLEMKERGIQLDISSFNTLLGHISHLVCLKIFNFIFFSFTLFQFFASVS